MKPTPTAKLLSEAGKLLYGDGPGSLVEFSEEVDVDRRTLMAWFSGKQELNPDHTVMDRAVSALLEYAEECARLAETIVRTQPMRRKPISTRREKVDA